MKYSLFLLSFILMISACKKDLCESTNCLNGGECIDGTCECPEGFEGDNCQISNQMLKSITLNGTLLTTFEYNEDGNIAALIGDQINYTFEYKKDTVIQYYVNNLSNSEGYTEYVSLGSGDIKSQSYYDEIMFSEYSLYSDLSSSCGFAKKEFRYSINDQVISESNKNFIDENCSYTIEVVYLADNTTFLKQEVIIDDKNYYYSSATPIISGNIQYGNIISYTEQDEAGEINLLNSYTSEYIYNADNYPIEETRISLSGTSQHFIYEYF